MVYFYKARMCSESADKVKKIKKNSFRIFFFYFPENYSRRVRKSTNKKILA